MLLIRCPYCEMERPELEFAYAGEAHIARPADPSTLSDEEWRDFLFTRSNPRARIMNAGGTSMAAAASSMPCATR